MKTSVNTFHETDDLEADEQSFGTNLNHLDEDSVWCINDQVIILLQKDIYVSCTQANISCGCIKKIKHVRWPRNLKHVTSYMWSESCKELCC
jgi:hypothetical protein